MDSPKSQTGQPFNSEQGLVNRGQFVYFTLYLTSGSSAGILNGLARKR